MVNKVGPKTDPCGTPLVTSVHPDCCPFITTLCCHPVSHFYIHISIFRPTPWALIFSSNLICKTLSNAFWKSKKISSTGRPVSTCCKTISMNSSKLVRHDLFDLNPCWLLQIKQLVSKKFIILALTILSNISVKLNSLGNNSLDLSWTPSWKSEWHLQPTNHVEPHRRLKTLKKY